MSTLLTNGANPAFDRIRPIVAVAAEALQKGDSMKAMSLYTEALVRGQEWVESEEEVKMMGDLVGNLVLLRINLKKESFKRLSLELIVRPGIEAVNRRKHTFGGSPGKLPDIAASAKTLSDDSLARRLRAATDLMAADRLKESEKILISLYNHTWEKGMNPDWRYTVANYLALLYIKLGTPKEAADILRVNKIDMDLDSEINEEYVKTLLYLALALKDDDMKLIWKCYLETATDLANRYNIDERKITEETSRILIRKNTEEPIGNQLDQFIRKNDRYLSFLTESQRETRWEKLRDIWADIKYDLLDSSGNVKDINDCLNAFQYEKQLMLRSTAKTMETLKRAEDEEAVALTNNLIRLRQKLAKPLFTNEDETKAEYERCQKELLHHHIMNGFENHLYNRLTTVDIAGDLEDNETFIDFGTLEAADGVRYYAILISPQVADGRIFPLCTVEQLDEFMKRTNSEESRRMVALRYGDDFLYKKMWQPILESGLVNEKIYYCPAGITGLIMPEAKCNHGRYLGEDFEFHILSSAEAIGNIHESTHYAPEQIYSFCAIDYYCERLALIANARMYGAERPVMPDRFEKDSNIQTAFSDTLSIPPLHNPEDFDWLHDECAKHDVPVLIATRHNASEHALKFLSGRDIGVLNIVTHAFSFPADLQPLEKPYFDMTTVPSRLNENLEIEYPPLYRTGIMLSGAERVWCRRNVIEGIEDGVVNGEELAALDLHGVDLLTLIACDTGDGDIDPEEGIIGLRRALKTAGCKTLVTTAWNLDKEAGEAYLQEFYSNLLDGYGIPAAHRKAQLELLKRFDNPYYWAVFQLVD